MQKKWLLAILCGLLVLLTNCQNPVDKVTNLHKGAGGQIIALGDSITAGYGLSPQQAYPALLSQKIGFPVLNKGVSGDTTAMGLARLQTDVLSQAPWIVIVGLGGNDFLRQVPKTETESNLKAIATQIQQQGAIVVLLGMNLGFTRGPYQELYERVANETGSLLISEVLKGIINEPKYRQEDIIHPNADGQELLATRIDEGLKPLLTKATWPKGLKPIGVKQ